VIALSYPLLRAFTRRGSTREPTRTFIYLAQSSTSVYAPLALIMNKIPLIVRYVPMTSRDDWLRESSACGHSARSQQFYTNLQIESPYQTNPSMCELVELLFLVLLSASQFLGDMRQRLRLSSQINENLTPRVAAHRSTGLSYNQRSCKFRERRG